jgi:transposase
VRVQCRMRGTDQQQNHVFSYIFQEQRVRKEHPLRPIRTMVDKVLEQLSPQFDQMYAKVGRLSIPPEQLLRAQLLQMFYSVRSERLLMDEMDYNTDLDRPRTIGPFRMTQPIRPF